MRIQTHTVLGLYTPIGGAIVRKSGVTCRPTPVTLSPDPTTTTMDPVAAKSSFLCMYMSSHKDTLASYVIYHGKVANTKITNAEMTSIDSRVLLHSRSLRSTSVSLFCVHRA